MSRRRRHSPSHQVAQTDDYASVRASLGTHPRMLPTELVSKAAGPLSSAPANPIARPATAQGPGAGLKQASLEMHVLQDANTYFKLYRGHPWVRAIVDKASQACAADDFHVERSSGETGNKEDAQATALKTVIKGLFGAVSFTAAMRAMYRDLYVNGTTYWLKVRSAAPVGDKAAPLVLLQRLDFRNTTPVVDDAGARVGYKFFPTGKYDYTTVPYPIDEVVCIQINDWGLMGLALARLEALDTSLALDIAATKVNKGYMENGAKAGDVYSFDPASMSPTQIERERQYIRDNYTKPDQSYTPMFLAGNIKLVHRGADSRKDADFLNLRKWTREEIASVFSFPLTLLSIDVTTGLGANIKEEDLLMWNNDEVAPMQRLVFDELQTQVVVSEYGVTEQVLVPPQVDRLRLEHASLAREMIKVGASGNQALRVLGLPDVEGLDTPLFLERANIVGIPGADDSAVITNTGVVSGAIQDPQALASAGAAPAGQTASGSGKKTPAKTSSGVQKADGPDDDDAAPSERVSVGARRPDMGKLKRLYRELDTDDDGLLRLALRAARQRDAAVPQETDVAARTAAPLTHLDQHRHAKDKDKGPRGRG